MSTTFIGVDAGGSGTRALLATSDGVVVGMGRADGANSYSSGTNVADEIARALEGALDGYGAVDVEGGAIAIAGGGATSEPIAGEVTERWRALGLPGSPRIVPDALAAFAAGTPSASGVVVSVGTGSVAAAVAGREIARQVGGHGWLVGDEGSAVWLGIEGARAVLRVVDGRDDTTLLATSIPEALGIEPGEGRATREAIVRAVYGRPPATLGQLAPVVVGAADASDPTAMALVRAAVDHIVALVVAAADGQVPATVVLAGSLLTRADGIARPVRAAVEERWPTARTEVATNVEVGSVALAAAASNAGSLADSSFDRLRADVRSADAGR